MPWFHGGMPGLNVGDELLPPAQTGKPTLLDYSRELAANTQRDDRVYLTRDPKAAALYAFGYPRGDVYEAEPIGQREPDTDCAAPGHSLQCERARVVRVTRRRVQMFGGQFTR